MSFLSRFGKSKGKEKASSTSNKKQQTTPTSSPSALLPLALPSTSLLDDSLITTPSPQKRGDESSSVKSSVGSSPWVKLDEGGVEQEDGLKGRKEREAREQGRCDRAVFGVAEATVLMKECGAVIRDRGLRTLGLFRPYRLAEKPSTIRNLCILFLNYANEHSRSASDSVAKDLFGAGSKEAKLEKFRDGLRYAGVHDVVGVLKWGLRHLEYTTPFGGPSSAFADSPLAWYHNFFLSSAESYHNTSAFHLQLLPSLPPSSADFLLATLDLLQSVVAHAEHNAMGSRKLCRTLGLYIFGLAPRDRAWNLEGGWTELYSLWQQAGEALEGCLRAYLRSQTSLPPRLMEVIEGYPGPSPSTTAGGKDSAGQRRRVVRIELETIGEWKRVGQEGVNSQQTGRVEGGLGGKDVFARREPLQIMLAAFEASSDVERIDEKENTAGDAWKVIAAQGKGAPREILSEETARVLELVGLDKLPGEATGDDSTPFSLSTTPTRPRRRSLSGTADATVTPALTVVAEGPMPFSSYHPSTKGRATIRPRTAPGPSTNFPNKSVGNLHGQFPSSSSGDSTLRQHPPSRIVTPSWSDFASSGFSDAAEFGLISPGSDEFPTRGVAAKAQEILNARNKGPDPVTKVVGITSWIMEDEFIDLWLDTLVDQHGACEGWPGLVVAQLAREVARKVEVEVEGEKIDHLLIAEKLIPYVAPVSLTRRATTRDAAPSIAESTRSRKWGRRASTLFNSSSFNNSAPRLASTSPQVSPKKNRASLVPPLPSLPHSASSSTISHAGPPIALGGLVSRTLGRRKSGQTDLPRPLSTVQDAPPVPPLPVSALPLAPSPISAPMSKTASEASTPASTNSGREKKISRVAVPVFDPEAEKEKEIAAAQKEQGGDAEEVLVSDAATEKPSSLATSKQEQDPPSFSPALAPESDEKRQTGLSTSPEGLAAAPLLAPAGSTSTHAGDADAEQVHDDTKEVEERDAEVEELTPDAVEESGEPSSTEGTSPSDPALNLVRSASVSDVPPLVAVDVEQMEQNETLADLADSASQLETAAADPGFNTEGAKELLVEPIPAEEASASAPFARRGSAQSSINDKPFGRRPSAQADDIGGLDIAQFVAEDEAIAAAETASTPLPPLGAVVESTTALDSTPVLEIKNPVDLAPAASTVPDAPAIDALLAYARDPATPLAELPETSVSAVEETGAQRKTVSTLAETLEQEEDEQVEQVNSPTFSLSPPAGDSKGEAQRFSDETMRSPDENGFATVDEAASAEPMESPVAGVVLPAVSSPLGASIELPVAESAATEAPPLVATPSKLVVAAMSETPISPTTLSPSIAEADLSRSLSQNSQTSVPMSPTPSNGSTSSTKKLLGTVGGFLRRKKSSVEQEKERLAKQEKAAQKEEIRQLKKLNDEEKKREGKERKAPTPVSSVKKRVLEIEAEAAELGGGAPPSPTGAARRLSSYPSNTSLSSSAAKSRPLSSFVLPTSSGQEIVHHSAKEPALLEDLPSALPTPTPISSNAPASLVETASDDPFLSPSSAPPPPPEFAPSALPPAEHVEAPLDAPTTPTAQFAPLPAISALGASESTPTKPGTAVLESAEEGHSIFAHPMPVDAPEPLATPSLKAAEEGLAPHEERKSPALDVNEEPKTFEAYPEGAPPAAELVPAVTGERASTHVINGELSTTEQMQMEPIVAEVVVHTPSPTVDGDATTTITSLDTDPTSPLTPTDTSQSTPANNASPSPSTPPRSIERRPSLDSHSTPVYQGETTTVTTSRPPEVDKLANDDAPTVLIEGSEPLAIPPKSSSHVLHHAASDNSMATSFQTAASEASSISTTATDERPWEQAETGL